MRSLTDLKVGDQVKLVVGMKGKICRIEQVRTVLAVNGNWYYADDGCAANGSTAYITGVER